MAPSPAPSVLESVVSGVDIPQQEQREITALYRTAVLTGSSAQLLGPGGERLRIPVPVYRVLVQVLKDLSEGSSVAVFQERQGLTTSQASRMLGMSRQYFVNLLDSGAIPHSMVGTHRRVRVQDVMAYKERRDRERRATLDQMLQSELETGGGAASLDDYAGQ